MFFFFYIDHCCLSCSLRYEIFVGHILDIPLNLSEMKEVVWKLHHRVAVVENELRSLKSNVEELNVMVSTILKLIELERNVKK